MTARLGVVGTGWWSTSVHIPTVRDCPDADVVAICDLDPERLTVTGDRFGIAKRYTDIHEMLERDALDGVMVSTPHVAHAAPAIAALEAGCHVVVEKPMATTAADGWAIASAAQRAGRQVLVPCGFNFAPHSIRAAEIVREGRIGTVRHAVCQMGSALDDLFAGEPMLETAGHLFRPPASTWADPKRAGGYGWGQMSHSLAWLFFVSGLRFESVFCMDGKSRAGVDLFDAATARATNGATVAMSGSGAVPKHVGNQLDVRLYGTEGCILFDPMRGQLELRRHDGRDEIIPIPAGETGYDGARPVRKFAELCAGKSIVNASDADCGARVTEALDALYRSAAVGAPEPVAS